MADYGFAVHVQGLDFDDEAQLLKLDDSEIAIVPSASDGLVMLDCVLAAASETTAWADFASFLAERAPAVSIVRIDLDLVSLSQIAMRLDVSRETVRLWARGLRREGFPAPFTSAGQSLFWAWADVFAWAIPRARSSDSDSDSGPWPLPVRFVQRVNGLLARDPAHEVWKPAADTD